MKIFLYYLGKPRDRNANQMAEEYLKRTSRYVSCQMRELQPKRGSPWKKHAAATKIALDPQGRTMTSRQFIRFIGKVETEARDVVFLVGGADGLPEAWRSEADLLISLSAMTFPHELARVMLAEQIYRAWAALRGHPYPR